MEPEVRAFPRLGRSLAPSIPWGMGQASSTFGLGVPQRRPGFHAPRFAGGRSTTPAVMFQILST